jgi:hypothetical protein
MSMNFGQMIASWFHWMKLIERMFKMSNQPLDIEAIRARNKGASPGPWKVGKGIQEGLILAEWNGEWWPVARAQNTPLVWHENRYKGMEETDRNLCFIANSRQDNPALCDEVEALRERVKELEGWIATAKSALDDCRDELNFGDHTYICVVTAIDCLAECVEPTKGDEV